MLLFSQIKLKYSDEIVNRNPRAILVEYLQYELLDSIYKQKGSEMLSFIGGTSIRIVYGSSRFSEDLDFDNFGLTINDFSELLSRVVRDMEYKGFLIEFRIIEKMAYHCYIKFPKLLAMHNIPYQPGEKILVRIDATVKNKIFEPKQFLLDGFNVYRHILVNPIEVILAQKIITIIQRKREKGRDLYDVSYLFGLTNPDYEYIKKMYGFEKEQLINNLNDRLSRLDLNELAKDVLPFLINPDDERRILSFREYIEQKLK